MKEEDSYIYYDVENQLHVGVYFEKGGGKICPYYILIGNQFKQAAAYISIKEDLSDCLKSMEYLKQINDNHSIPQMVKSSLLFSAIVKYAKCFTSGEGRGTSLNDRHIFKGAEHQKKFHKKTMDLRHKYLAHAGNSTHESFGLLAVLNPNPSNKKIEEIKYAGFRLKDDDSNIDNYVDLITHVSNQINKKIKKLIPIVNQKADEISINEMYLNAKTPDRTKFIPFRVNLMEKDDIENSH